MGKEDWQWLISLLVTIYFGYKSIPKKKEKPTKRRKPKRKR